MYWGYLPNTFFGFGLLLGCRHDSLILALGCWRWRSFLAHREMTQWRGAALFIWNKTPHLTSESLPPHFTTSWHPACILRLRGNSLIFFLEASMLFCYFLWKHIGYFQPYKYELYPTRYSILCGHTRNLSALWKKRKTKIKRIKETFYQGNKVEF